MSDETGNVVIVAEDGRRHVFPPGFDPIKAAAIVKGAQPATEEAPPQKMSAAPPMPAVDPKSAALTAGAYAVGQAGRLVPAINKVASTVAASTKAQKAIAAIAGGTIGLSTHGPVAGAAEAVIGERLHSVVGGAAKALAAATKAAPTTATLPNGQIVKIIARSPTWLKTVLSKLGPAMGMASSEADALTRLNSPEAVEQFIQSLKPEQRTALLNFARGKM